MNHKCRNKNAYIKNKNNALHTTSQPLPVILPHNANQIQIKNEKQAKTASYFSSSTAITAQMTDELFSAKKKKLYLFCINHFEPPEKLNQFFFATEIS